MTKTQAPKQFRTKAERMFRHANSDAAATATIEWLETSRIVTYPTGVKGRWGRFVATAPGFQSRIMHVSADPDGSHFSVR